MAFPFNDLYWGIRPKEIYGLVGAPGTGKSFRAKLLAQKHGIEAIIDDGLLIKEDKILAGHSAKREKNYLAAVRVALFDDKPHRDEIAKALQKLSKIKKILILGTSEKMVQIPAQSPPHRQPAAQTRHRRPCEQHADAGTSLYKELLRRTVRAF